MAIQTHTLGVYDEAGRYLGPAQVEIVARPFGPWSTNAATQPRAVYAFHQPTWDNGPGFPMFTVQGGSSDGSTVSAGTLADLGIAVPAWRAA
jgi:hypothetical protein